MYIIMVHTDYVKYIFYFIFFSFIYFTDLLFFIFLFFLIILEMTHVYLHQDGHSIHIKVLKSGWMCVSHIMLYI